jgi:hypothetical protein
MLGSTQSICLKSTIVGGKIESGREREREKERERDRRQKTTHGKRQKKPLKWALPIDTERERKKRADDQIRVEIVLCQPKIWQTWKIGASQVSSPISQD